MKTILIAFVCFVPVLGFSQTADTAGLDSRLDSLIDVAQAFTNDREFDQALEAIAQAEKMVLETVGKESAAYGTTCFHHGRVLHIKGDYPEAERWYVESADIRRRVLGPFDVEYSKNLNNLAGVYRNVGNYEKAEPLYRECLAIRAQALGKKDPAYASALVNLAILLTDLSRYEEAEPLLYESQAIYRELYGVAHPQYARSSNILATLYMETGDFESAEPLYLETIETQKTTLGEAASEYAESLLNLGNLYLVMGNYDRAEPLYLAAKKIWETELGKNHSLYILCINNLATLYTYTLEYDKAETHFLEALEAEKMASGVENPDYARSLHNLANLYSREDKFEKAEGLYLQAAAIYQTAFGKEHPDYARSQNNLAELYLKSGQFEKAEPLYREAGEIWKKTFGQVYWEYLTNLTDQADLFGQMGKEEPAVSSFITAAAIQQSLLTKAVHHLSEQELGRYQQTFEKNQARLLAYTAQTKRTVLVETCYDDALFYKGFLLNASSRIRKLALADSAGLEKYHRLKALERRLATEYSKPQAERQEVENLENQARQQEKELARTVAGYSEARQQVHWRQIQSALQSGEAALEFVHYRLYRRQPTDSVLYAALLIRPDTDQPIFIPLFEEQQLDSLVHSQSVRKADYVNQLYTLSHRGATPVGQPKKSLYELLWQPLEPNLNDVKTIYFSPTGLLHRLNLGAIPVEEETTLADRFQLVELGSTRQLAVQGVALQSTAGPAMLFGGINYDIDRTIMAKLPDDGFASRNASGFSSASSTPRKDSWKYLKWTEKEVTALEQILTKQQVPFRVKQGYFATEEVFKSMDAPGLPAPRILHLATHGYFFPDPEMAQQPGPVFKISDHPMMRSGLILAGANYAWQTGKPISPGREDGILTAYEISQLNLSGTELVVLSACETGLGDIQGNEGVYGLQRAFKIAGARYLIMSLWQVPDYQTQELMTSFYTKWLEDNLPIPAAFQAAQKEMKEKYQSPYFWAGFVLVE